MPLGPHDIARRLQHRHSPRWLVWYGSFTRQFWALAHGARTPDGMLAATTPDALDAAITAFENRHPENAKHRSHAMDPRRIR
ncbi:MAG TPA: hypothetical protein VFU43_29565 [Streptosporangiaceae bacterium]|nr:hypothetical protein [Streptosporangiaceae bacterium]